MERWLHLVRSFAEQPGRVVDRGAMIEQFSNDQRMRGLTAATVRRRTWTLTKFSETVALETATRVDVEAFISARATAASRRALLGDLRAFYVFAIDHDMLTNNPTAKIGKIVVPKHSAHPLTTAELGRAVTAAHSASLRAIVMLGAYAGLRVSEIAALRWDQVDYERGVLGVREGKGLKDRMVPLAVQLADDLAVLCHRSDGFVIGTTGPNVSQRVRGHFGRLGIDHRPHDLRATFATQAIRSTGGNVRLVQKWLGHTDPKTTMSYLAWMDEGRAAIDSLYGDAA